MENIRSVKEKNMYCKKWAFKRKPICMNGRYLYELLHISFTCQRHTVIVQNYTGLNPSIDIFHTCQWMYLTLL